MDKPEERQFDQETMDRIRKALNNMRKSYEDAALRTAAVGMQLGKASDNMRPEEDEPQYGPEQDGLR